MTFGEKLKQERRNRNMDQASFAKLLGVSVHSVSDYETGKAYPRTRKAYDRIAKTLNLNINFLLTEEDEFLLETAAEYGSRGKRSAKKLLDDAAAMYAGGEMADEDMEELIFGLQEIFIDAKRKNREKYTPKKHQK